MDIHDDICRLIAAIVISALVVVLIAVVTLP